MSPLLLASIEPPTDLSTWVGGLVLTTVLTALVTAAISNWGKSGEKVDKVQADAAAKVEAAAAASAAARATADAEWKAELRSDLKRLIEVQNQLVTGQGLQSKDITSLTTRLDHLEKRQEMQAAAHLREIDALRQEVRPRPTRRGK